MVTNLSKGEEIMNILSSITSFLPTSSLLFWILNFHWGSKGWPQNVQYQEWALNINYGLWAINNGVKCRFINLNKCITWYSTAEVVMDTIWRPGVHGNHVFSGQLCHEQKVLVKILITIKRQITVKYKYEHYQYRHHSHGKHCLCQKTKEVKMNATFH